MITKMYVTHNGRRLCEFEFGVKDRVALDIELGSGQKVLINDSKVKNRLSVTIKESNGDLISAEEIAFQDNLSLDGKQLSFLDDTTEG